MATISGFERRGVCRDFIDGPAQLRKSQVSIFLRRRSHADQRDIGVSYCVRGSRGGQASRGDIFLNQLFQTGLEEGSTAAQNILDFMSISVDSEHLMSQAGQTGSRHAPDVTKSEYGNVSWILRFQTINPQVFSMARVNGPDASLNLAWRW